MTGLFELGAAVAVALVCALHMLWRMRRGTRAGGATALLAKRIETLSRNGSTPHRH